MLQNESTFSRQLVRNELLEAQRKLENIGTLSGNLVSLAHINDTRTPLGHLIPNLVQNIQSCFSLLTGYEEQNGGPMTFADLRRMKPKVYDVFCEAIDRVREIDRQIQYHVACEKLGIKP